MNKKVNLIATFSSLGLALAIMVFAVYTAISVSFQVDISVSYIKKFNYVSFGDSIAVGYGLDYWRKNNGYNLENGVNGRTYTEIIPDSYTSRIYNTLKNKFGSDNVTAINYAHSGDMVDDLLIKLGLSTSQFTVDEAVSYFNKTDISSYTPEALSVYNADLVTICIGANNALTPALNNIMEFLQAGSTMTLDNMLQALDQGSTEAYNQFPILLKSLQAINAKNSSKNTKFIFTDIYNPFRGLGFAYNKQIGFTVDLDDVVGNLIDAVVSPLNSTIDGINSAINAYNKIPFVPDIGTINKIYVDLPEYFIGFKEEDLIRQYVIPERINVIGLIAEPYISGKQTGTVALDGKNYTISPKYGGLNNIIKECINSLNDNNFTIIETHDVFESQPLGTALSDSDKFRGGPGTSRWDKGCVNAWLNAESGILDSCLELDAANWGLVWNNAYNSAINNLRSKDWSQILDLSWHSLDLGSIGNYSYPTFNGFKFDVILNYITSATSAYVSAFYSASAVLIQEELSWAPDPHPTRHGHDLIFQNFMNQIDLINFDY